MARGGVRIQILGEFNPKGFEEAQKAAEGLSGQMKNLAKTVGAAFATREVINFAKSAVSAASDLGESINAVNVTFGDASAGILALGENAATAVGLSAREFNAFAVQFSGFTQQIAGSERSVVEVTDELTTRIADFASVMNQDIPEAAQVFQSALAGETEPIRRFGIDMSAAAVQAYALREGMVASASEMTEAIKVQARYGLLMESTNKVAGDFSNTSDSLANQQRILAAQMDDLRSTVGAAMVPALEGLMKVVGPLVEAFTALPEGLQQIIAISALAAVGFKSLSTTLQGLGLAASTANKSLGAVGLVIGAAATLYTLYSQNKGAATSATNDFIEALRLEGEEQRQAIEALALTNDIVGESVRGLDALGLTVEDLDEAVMNGTGPLEDLLELVSDSRYAFADSQTQLGILNNEINANNDYTDEQIGFIKRLADQLGSLRTKQLAEIDTLNATNNVMAESNGLLAEITHSQSQFGDVVLETADDVRVFIWESERAARAQERQLSANQSAIEAFVAVGESLEYPIQQTRSLVEQLGLLDGMSIEMQIELGLFTQAEAALEMLDIQIRAIRTSMIALGQTQFMQQRLAPLFQLRNELVGLIQDEASQPFTGRGGGAGGGESVVDSAEQDFERYVDAIVSFGNNLMHRDFARSLFEGTPESIREVFRDIMDDVAALTEGQLDQSLNGLIGNLQGRFAQLASLAELRDTLQTQLESINDLVEETGGLFKTGLEASAEESLKAQLTRRVGEARAFVTNLRKLVGMGFPSAIIGDIVNAGLVDGAAMAAELASFSPREVQRFVSQFAQLGEFTRQAQALVSELLGGPEVEEALAGTNQQMDDLVTAIQVDLRDAVSTFLSGLGAQVDRLTGVQGVSGDAGTVWHPIHGRIPIDGSATSRMGSKGGTQVNVTVNAGMGTDGTQVGRQIVQVLNEYAASGGARLSSNLVA